MPLQISRKIFAFLSPIISLCILSILFLSLPVLLFSEDGGYKYLRNYSYHDYDHQSQNWWMTQTSNGIMYVANQGGVLEYDGVSWNIYYIPGNYVRVVAADNDGTVYVGASGEFGYLAPDSKGKLGYVSLLPKIENKNVKNFSFIKAIHITDEGIWFRTGKYLFLWDRKKMHTFEGDDDDSFMKSANWNGGIVVIRPKGLYFYKNGQSIPVEGGDTLKEKVYLLLPLNQDTASLNFLVGSSDSEISFFDGKTLKKLDAPVYSYIKNKKLFYGMQLSTGDFAFGTIYGGVVISKPDGTIKKIYDRKAGLQDNSVKHIFEDSNNNLWVSLERGVSKIEYNFPVSVYDERCGLNGVVTSVLNFNGTLYAGTTKGLFVREKDNNFSSISGIPINCLDIIAINHSVLVATYNGLYQLKDRISNSVLDKPSYVLYKTGINDIKILCGVSDGIVRLSLKNGDWVKENQIKIQENDVKSIATDSEGDVWFSVQNGDVFRLKAPIQWNTDSPIHYNNTNGLPSGEVYITFASKHLIFATNKGLYTFDKKLEKFIPDYTLGANYAGGASPIFRLKEDINKNIWFHSGSKNFLAKPNNQGVYTISSSPLHRIPTVQINFIYPDPSGNDVWLASIDGLFDYQLTDKPRSHTHFKVLIRKVTVNDNVLFDDNIKRAPMKTKDGNPELSYDDRNIIIHCALPFFEKEDETRYRYFLEGYNKTWSNLTKNSQAEFTNLDSGYYIFHAQAVNVYDIESTESTFRFRVLPPWYKTWYAYLFYSIIGFFAIAFLIKLRYRYLEKEKKRLEKEKQNLEIIVEERTKEIKERSREISEKNIQLEDQTKKLQEQSDKLKELDQIKSRFFANISHEFRTPLTLIISPIEQMLQSINDRKQKKSLNTVLQNSQRLLTLINQLLDLSKIDSGKMKIRASLNNIVSFLKGLLGSFEGLADQCGIKLEFITQEEEILIYFDPYRMEEIIFNLLINALKFTPSGGNVSLIVSRNRGNRWTMDSSSIISENDGIDLKYIRISVSDTGPGIAPDQMNHIFDRFSNTDEMGEKIQKGSGIGLALSRELIHLHHGKIIVHSRLGEGTEFEILLPTGNSHLKPDEIDSENIRPFKPEKHSEIDMLFSCQESQEDLLSENTTQNHDIASPNEGTESDESDRIVILLVEDNADVRQYIKEPLEGMYKIIEAENGLEGIQLAKEHIPDLIISDIMMPGTDGYELCKTLKNDIETSHIPIILLTAKASEDSQMEGLKIGADDYITKPFNSRILLSKIKNLIEIRRQLQEKIQIQKTLLPPEIHVKSLDRKFMEEVHDIILANLSDPEFDIEMLTRKLLMGRSSVFRKIKAITGETPNDYIRTFRLHRAEQLFRQSSGNVTEVAMDVGFSSSSYFSTCFTKLFGITPKDFIHEIASGNTEIILEKQKKKK